MSLKFWQKKDESEAAVQKLPAPKRIPELVGRFLVVRLQKDPDWVWNLNVVERPRPDSKSLADVRVYDPAQAGAKNLSVKNYASLDATPELILFEGWYDKKAMKVEVVGREAPVPHAA